MKKTFTNPVIILVTFVLFFVVINSCQSGNELKPENTHHISQENSDQDSINESETTFMTYLALGDSYTIGEGVTVEDRYPVQLQSQLVENNIHLEELKIIAQTGWTTGQLLDAIESTTLNEQYGMVSLLIGVNNQYRGMSINHYREEFETLLDMSIEFAGQDPEKVIVLSIPDWGVTPYAEGQDREKIAREIDAFNHVNLEESEKKGVHYINVTDISRMAATQPNLIAGDGLHPSGIMYAMWVDKMIPLAISIFEKQQD
ncbi:MAG: SGNH/GDSL hydrolase family protein [Bacteroidota bacterium]